MSQNASSNWTTNFVLELDQHGGAYEDNKLVFWGLAMIFLFIASIAIFGNGILLYVTYYSMNDGPLENLDIVIKSLAMADMLLGLIGIPSRLIVSRYEGTYKDIFVTLHVIISLHPIPMY